MIVTTTASIEGKRIRAYHGVVAGHAGANRPRNTGRGPQQSYQEILAHAHASAIGEMSSAAERAGGNAIVGVGLEHQVFGYRDGEVMVIATGTAVTVE